MRAGDAPKLTIEWSFLHRYGRERAGLHSTISAKAAKTYVPCDGVRSSGRGAVGQIRGGSGDVNAGKQGPAHKLPLSACKSDRRHSGSADLCVPWSFHADADARCSCRSLAVAHQRGRDLRRRPQDANKVVATVGGDPITEADVTLAETDLDPPVRQDAARPAPIAPTRRAHRHRCMAARPRQKSSTRRREFKQRLAFLRDRALHSAYFKEKIADTITDADVKAATTRRSRLHRRSTRSTPAISW